MNNRLQFSTALGYGVEDYIMMFDLTETELDRSILDCHSGISVFAEEMASSRHNVVASDPLYQQSVENIRQIIVKAQSNLISDVESYPERYHYSVLELSEKIEQRAIRVERFLKDLPKGLIENRYHTDGLPSLKSFQKEHFNLALVHHFFFRETLDLSFHIQSIDELMRVSNEIRIFPLVGTDGELSPLIGDIVSVLQCKGLGAELRAVPSCFQKKDNAMLRVWNQSCSV